jgi:3-methyladenine DNA glycosylase Tag
MKISSACCRTPGIIRHRGKIQAIIGNARAFLAMEENGESFTDFVWSFVDNQPQVTHAATLAEIPPPRRPPTRCQRR